MSAVVVRTKGKRGVIVLGTGPLGTDLQLDRALGKSFDAMFTPPAPKAPAPKPVPAATVEELQLRLAAAVQRQRDAITPAARRTARTKAKALRQRLRLLGVLILGTEELTP